MSDGMGEPIVVKEYTPKPKLVSCAKCGSTNIVRNLYNATITEEQKKNGEWEISDYDYCGDAEYVCNDCESEEMNDVD